MSLYDEEDPLLVRPRPFWEEEPVEIAQPVAPPAAPPPEAPPPEVEGPGYSSPEEIAAKAVPSPPPEVVGPGFTSAEAIPVVKELPPPEVEGPGYASPEEIVGAKPTLGDVARAGYRTLVAPLTEPLETVGRMGKALMPEGTRRREFVDRFKRNFATAMEETKAAARQMPSGLLRAEQNPYVNKSVEEAKADVPKLEEQIAAGEKNLTALGGQPEFVGQEWSLGADLTPEQREQSQKLGDLKRQLGYAKEGATGKTTESFAGALSRSAADIAQENRDRKAEIIKEYAPLINKAHDKELWMQVADSLGSSGPSMVGSMMNPLFGLGLMYAQTFEMSRAEFLEKGGDPAKADEYAHAQALIQTPMEVLGELPVAGIAKGALKRLVKEGDPAAWVKWIKESAVELGKSFAGEVGFTTPGQTIAEQKIGEAYGVKPVKSWEELQKDVVEAQKVAALQVGVAGGGPLAVEAGTRLATQGVQGAVTPQVVVPPGASAGAPAVPPPIPPTPPEAFAPPPAGAPPVTPPGAQPPVEVPGALPGEQPAYVNVGPGAPPVTGDERFAPPGIPPTIGTGVTTLPVGTQIQHPESRNVYTLDEQGRWMGGPRGDIIHTQPDANSPIIKVGEGPLVVTVATGVVPPTIETGPRTPQGDAVTQVVGEQNLGVTQVAKEKADTLQAAGAPKTAEAIQQVAKRSNVEASVTAAEYLEQAKQQAAEAAAEAQAKADEAAAKFAPAAEQSAAEAPGAVKPGEFAQPGYTAVTPAPPVAAPPVIAPQPAPVTEPPAAVVVGGQMFTGPTLEDATRAAYGAVGGDAMNTAQSGWVDQETGHFVSHDFVEAHQALNAAMEQAGGNPEHPAVAEAGAQLAEAQARDTEINGQIVQPSGEQVVQTGVKGQEAVVSVRPSQELVTPLAGVNVSVGWTDTQGRTTTAQRPAAQALNDARNDKTALTILLNCLT